MNGFILKILSGPQSGAEVALSPGEYSLGSGEEDDLQFNDLSLEAGHARLRVGQNAVEISAGAGDVSSSGGLALTRNSGQWREVEQLDILTIGMIQFAIGAPTANWTSLIEAREEEARSSAGKPGKQRRKPSRAGSILAAAWRRNPLAYTGAGVLFAAVLALAVLYVPGSREMSETPQKADPQIELARVEEAIAGLDFQHSLKIRQEADGQIFVTGHVGTLAERRAVLNALADSGAQSKNRLWVLNVMRDSIDNLRNSVGLDFSYTLDDDGDLALSGVILDKASSDALVETIREQVAGLGDIRSEIVTADSLLRDVSSLAERSGIASTVLFHLDGPLIEASGIIPQEKIDVWAGFVEAYIQQFARLIPLRSYVQLAAEGRSEMAQAPGRPETPVVIAQDSLSRGGERYDITRFQMGDYNVNELFAGPAVLPGSAGSQNAAAQDSLHDLFEPSAASRPAPGGPWRASVLKQPDTDAQSAGKESSAQISDAVTGLSLPDQPSSPSSPARPRIGEDGIRAILSSIKLPNTETGGQCGSLPASPVRLAGPPFLPSAMAPGDATEGAPGGDSLISMTRDLVNAWLQGKLAGRDESVAGATDLSDSIEQVAAAWAQRQWENHAGGTRTDAMRMLAEKLASCRPVALPCWPGAKLDSANLPAAIFWLDMATLSDNVSLARFRPENKRVILEAGLNPRRAMLCARMLAGSDFSRLSHYLGDSIGNRRVAAPLADNAGQVPMPISGANISVPRFIQIDNGLKFHEGSAPTRKSRLLHIGELGVLLRIGDELAVAVYRPNMAWIYDAPRGGR